MCRVTAPGRRTPMDREFRVPEPFRRTWALRRESTTGPVLDCAFPLGIGRRLIDRGRRWHG